MTPSQMFQNYGSGEKTSFQKGDKVNTPNGLAEFISQFTRGLKWWCETSTGTFRAETINSLNQQNYQIKTPIMEEEDVDDFQEDEPCSVCGDINGMVNPCCPHYDPLHYKNCGYG